MEFSKPHATKPIPEGTVKVFFNIIQLQSENGDDNGYEIEFNFENESLKHKLNNTMRKNMFEVSYLSINLVPYLYADYSITLFSNGSIVFWKTN